MRYLLMTLTAMATGCANLPDFRISQPIGAPPVGWVDLETRAAPDPVAGIVEVRLNEGIGEEYLDFTLTPAGGRVTIYREAQNQK